MGNREREYGHCGRAECTKQHSAIGRRDGEYSGEHHTAEEGNRHHSVGKPMFANVNHREGQRPAAEPTPQCGMGKDVEIDHTSRLRSKPPRGQTQDEPVDKT